MGLLFNYYSRKRGEEMKSKANSNYKNDIELEKQIADYKSENKD